MIGATTLGQGVRAIADSLGIDVALPDGDAPLPPQTQQMHIFPGYTAYFLCEEYARSVGMLVWDDENGNLVISKGGTFGRAGSAIVEGVNAEQVDIVLTADQRYARYRVFGQGQDMAFGHYNSDATEFDPEAGELGLRLKILPLEIPDVNQLFSKQRALFEANRRWGRGKLARVVVTGWRDGQGQLWKPNSIVNVSLPTGKVNEDR